MGLHKPFDRDFYTVGGAIMTEGYSLNLAKGQFGIFDESKTSKDGTKAVSSFLGKPKNNLYKLKLGKTDLSVTRSQSNKNYFSFPFKLSQVLDLTVSTPNVVEQKVDELIVGYNGLDADTAIKFKKGDIKKLMVRLEGEPIGMLGYPHNMVDVPVYMEADSCSPTAECVDCDPCEAVPCLPVVTQAIETLKNFKLKGDVPVSHFIDVTPVRKCDTSSNNGSLIDYNFYCLDVCDTGDETAIALIQTQYPTLKIERTGRKGAISSYKFIQAASEPAPPDFEQTLASIIKGCEDCPAGYVEQEGGLVYAITLEDDGVDQSTVIETLANAIAGTAKKSTSQNDGVGYYTVVLSSKLSDQDFDTFVQANPTSTIDFVGDIDSICSNDTVNTIAWTQCGTCQRASEKYQLTLPDNECGQDRLAELQAFYPSFTVTIALDENDAPIVGACRRKYEIVVPTNLVCPECDPIFQDYFVSEYPQAFEDKQWTLVEKAENLEDCLCGIRIKGKVLEIYADECLRDEVGFIESSVKVRASGGYLTEVREGIGETVDNPFAVEYVTRFEKRTHVGGNLWNFENESRTFFTGESRHSDYLARILKGELSSIEPNAQYVQYGLTIRRTGYSQSFSGLENETITFNIFAEVGRHKDLEDLLNTLASAADLSPVKAYGDREVKP